MAAEIWVYCEDSSVPPMCAINIRFDRETNPRTRWALAISEGLTLLGNGKSVTGPEREQFSTTYVEGRPVKRVPIGRKRVPIENAGMAGGRVILGIVGRGDEIESRWHAGPNRGWWGLMRVVDPRRQRYAHFGMTLPRSMTNRANGITAGAMPRVGFGGSNYRIAGSKARWRVPDRVTYGAGAYWKPGPSLLGESRSTPEPETPGEQLWSSTWMLVPRWAYFEPDQQTNARTQIFVAGVVLSLATGLLVALIEVILINRPLRGPDEVGPPTSSSIRRSE